MIRVFVDRSVEDNRTCLVEDEFWNHYLTTVRRLGEGDEVEVVGPDRLGRAEILSEEPLTLAVGKTRSVQRPAHDLVLAQALTRKKKFEQSVKLGTELGVTEFVPLITERTVREPRDPEKQRDRWKKIAVDAARISRRETLPKIALPVSIDQGIELLEPYEVVLVGDAEGAPVEDVLKPEGTSTGLFVGPEGGFTSEERTQLLESGAQPVGLKAENLRAETASIALLVLIQARMGVL